MQEFKAKPYYRLKKFMPLIRKLEDVGFVLTGGAVIPMIRPQRRFLQKFKDLDLFTLDDKSINLANDLLTSEGWTSMGVSQSPYSPFTDYTYSIVKQGDYGRIQKKATVQLIDFSDVKDVKDIIDTFDFTVCQAYMHNDTIYCTDRCIEDNKNRIVRWVDTKNIRNPNCSLSRLIAYKEKGYTIDYETLFEFISQISEDSERVRMLGHIVEGNIFNIPEKYLNNFKLMRQMLKMPGKIS